MTGSKRTPQEYATWADVLKGLAVLALAVVAVFVKIARQDKITTQEMQKNQKAKKELDSLVKDSLSNTIEYQNAVRYFDSIQKSH